MVSRTTRDRRSTAGRRPNLSCAKRTRTITRSLPSPLELPPAPLRARAPSLAPRGYPLNSGKSTMCSNPFIVFLLLRLGQVALAGVEDDRLVADEVRYGDGVGDVAREGPVAAVGDRPLRAADGGGAVAAARAELTLGIRFEELEGLARQGRGGCVRGIVFLAGGVGWRTFERALDERERGQPFAGAPGRLGDLEDG